MNWAILCVVALVSAGLLAAEYQRQTKLFQQERATASSALTQKERQFEQSIGEMRVSHEARIAELTRAHTNLLNNKDLISGSLAQERRNTEWRRRLWHDPEFAQSPMERALLKMEALGRDSTVSTKDALAEVATLASPPGSRIEVTPIGNRHRVRVAFRMGAVSHREVGAVTRHQTTAAMREEVQQISANIMRALFEFCGTRGIESVTLTCNHAMRRIATNVPAAERDELLRTAPVTMGALYTVTIDGDRAEAIHNWREISPAAIIKLMRVDYDGFNTLTITQGVETLAEDPDAPLEF